MDQYTTACSLQGGLKAARVGAHQTGAPSRRGVAQRIAD